MAVTCQQNANGIDSGVSILSPPAAAPIHDADLSSGNKALRSESMKAGASDASATAHIGTKAAAASVAGAAESQISALNDLRPEENERRQVYLKRLEESSGKLRAEIAEAKALGLSVTASPLTITKESDQCKGMAMVIRDTPGVRLSDYSPDRDFYSSQVAPQRVSSDLSAGLLAGRSVVAPYFVYCHQLSPERSEMLVYDTLRKEPLCCKIVERKGGICRLSEEQGKRLQTTLRETWKARASEYEEIIAGIAPARSEREPAVIQTMPAEAAGGAALRDKDFASSASKIRSLSISVIPAGEALERPVDCSFTSRQLAGLSDQQLLVRGHIEKLVIEAEIPKARDSEIFPDQYKTRITSDSGHVFDVERANALKGEDFQKVTITLVPPLPSPGKNAGPGDQPLSLDLSAIGGPSSVQLIRETPLKHVDKSGAQEFFTNLREDRQASIPGALSSISGALGRLCSDFGQRPDTVSRVYILESLDANAYFKPEDKTSLFLHSPILQNPALVEMAVRHETAHLLDEKLELSLGAMDKRFSELSQDARAKEPEGAAAREFFNQISEDKFYKVQTGGHPAASSSEFLATFVTSLYHPEWGPRLRQTTPEFRAEYLKTLMAFKEELDQASGLAADAPIRKDIECKATFIRNLEIMEMTSHKPSF